LHYSASRGKN